MQFDDRLATVLRMRTDSAAGERTQLRQLLDLLGTATARQAKGKANESAFARLAQLQASIPADEQAKILREAGLRLRNPQLVEFLASSDPKPAASVLAIARLSEQEWETLIPRLPITARGFLRHRRDLPAGALRQLEQLGVGDLVLSDDRIVASTGEFIDTQLTAAQPLPPVARPAPPAPIVSVPPAPEVVVPTATERSLQPISDIIERIEKFRVSRRVPVLAPRLPLGDATTPEAVAQIESFDAVTDTEGRVVWASATIAPLLVGMALTTPQSGQLVKIDMQTGTALRQRQPLRAALLHIDSAPAITGAWRIDAAPAFGPGGAFTGYRCRLFRALAAREPVPEADSHADRMREVLHELRTPVNAIQGFAEIIQQQLFGQVPHDYRAHAAAIAVDAAKLLAGFDDLDRLARMESGDAAPEAGEADLRNVVDDTLRRLASVLRAREAGFDLVVSGTLFTLGIAQSEAMALCWRILASATGALATGERSALRLEGDGSDVRLDLALPLTLRDRAEPPRGSAGNRAVVSAGMFGPQFAFRLAAAEAKAAGGSLEFSEDNLRLTMPVLTGPAITHSTQAGISGG